MRSFAKFAVRGTLEGLFNDGMLQGLRALNGGSGFNAQELFGAGLAGGVGWAVGGAFGDVAHLARGATTHVAGATTANVAEHLGTGLVGNMAAALAQDSVTGQAIDADSLIGGLAHGAVVGHATGIGESRAGRSQESVPAASGRDGAEPAAPGPVESRRRDGLLRWRLRARRLARSRRRG